MVGSHTNSVALTIPKWRTFKLLRWVQNLHQLTWENADKSANDGQLLTSPFFKSQKYECDGHLKFKIRILFYGGNLRTVAFRWMKFGTVKDHGHA
jgi:hypothetical protein